MGKKGTKPEYSFAVPVSKKDHKFIEGLPDKYKLVLRRKLKTNLTEVLDAIDNAMDLGV